MKFAIYNPVTNRILTWVTEPKGALPDGYIFLPEDQVTQDAVLESVSEQIPVPKEVPMWALKEVCVSRNHTAAIDAALAGLLEPSRVKAMLRWEYKDTISRGSSIIAAMQAILGWTNAYVDELFVASEALAKS